MPQSTSLSRAQALRAWSRRQGLGAKVERSPREILVASTWVRTLGGADPYFALFARGAPRSREAIDEAITDGELRVTPAVRGCMYLVAAAHADLCLSLAFHSSDKRSRRDLEKAGGTARQVGNNAKAIVRALESGPMTTAELRSSAAAKAITSFGEAGKKVGLSSTLPVALRQLEFDGAIERTPIDGRLDTETYRWSLRERPLTRHAAAEAEAAIATLFFDHHAPASFDHFVEWSGLGKRAARAAIATLGLIEVTVEGHDPAAREPMLATEAALELAHAKAPAQRPALLGLQDTYLVVHGGPAWACPAAHLELEIPRWGSMRGGPLRATRHPHLRAVVVAGELVGFWDVDAAIQRQVVTWLSRPSKAAVRQAEAELAALRGFMAESLGHAKTFSIDSDAKIDERFELVAALAP